MPYLTCFLFMLRDYGKFILKQLDYSPSFFTSNSQLGCASLTICLYKTQAHSLIVNYMHSNNKKKAFATIYRLARLD